MSAFPNNYLMNIEKPKIMNKNRQNKYIASKPSFLMTSNTYKYFQDKTINYKNTKMVLTTNTINYPFNKDILTTKNSKKYFKNLNNNENKENMKNKYNTNNNTLMNNKINNSKTDRTILVNKFHNKNSNKENIDNNNFKKLKITQKKKGRTLSSNLNKIINQNFEKGNEIKTFRKETKKDNNLILNDLIPTHRKSHSIILSQNNPNLFQSKSFCFDGLIKQRQSHKNNSVLRNSIINQQNNNNKSIFNNTTSEFYTRLKHIIPTATEENNNSNNKIKEYKSKESFELNKYMNMNKSFTSSNLIKKFGLNQYQNTTYNINSNNNININNYMSLNKNKKKQKTKSITSLTNLNLYLNKHQDSILTKTIKNKENHPKIFKKILKIDSCTIPGYSLNGVKQKNLDAFFLKKNFLDKEENFFIGICDGHGIYGDLVSKYISQNLPLLIKNTSKENLTKAFIDINESLIDKNKTKIDCSLSGCTCTSLIVSLDKIICANIGNTRAILSRYENGCYNSINLNRDHKPTESDEIKRIISQGGEIKQSFNKTKKKYIGPERIWLKNSDIPGLSMSRSFGDNLAHTIGVINIPEINYYDFTGSEKFIVIASDSIWQFIDSDECVEIIKEFYEKNLDAIGALNALVTEAIKRWKKQENRIEDITAVVIFFE